MTHALDERSQSILLELIRDHIEKAEPVGSRSLAKSYFNKLSPATIRNVMSDLEEMGYLHQPHISAGRIPTDKGYRFFVNHILDFPIQGNSNLLSVKFATTNPPIIQTNNGSIKNSIL